MNEFFAQPRPKKSAFAPPPKKRKTVHKIEEITFDRDARTEYLTGFRKRKLARIKYAQEQAEIKAREERIELRKQIREERRQNMEEHIEAVHKILREAEGAGQEINQDGESEEEWGGLPDEVAPEPPVDHEEEYIDEDLYTTVTVEAVSVDRDGIHKPKVQTESDGESTSGKEAEKPTEAEDESGKEDKKDWPKKKKKKFRYETKFERRGLERAQKAKKARR